MGATNLIRFSELDDVRIADGDADIRGWEVVTAEGREIGPVRELIVDIASSDHEDLMPVHLAEVELDLRRFGLGGTNPRILVPIASVRFDTHRRQVRLEVLSSAAALRLLPYEGGPITPEYERCFSGWVAVERKALTVEVGHAARVDDCLDHGGEAARRRAEGWERE